MFLVNIQSFMDLVNYKTFFVDKINNINNIYNIYTRIIYVFDLLSFCPNIKFYSFVKKI